jgi:hypothetical protein
MWFYRAIAMPPKGQKHHKHHTRLIGYLAKLAGTFL